MKNAGRWMMIVAVAPSVAEAHLTSSGLGPFYDGLLHLMTSPEDLAAAIALACGRQAGGLSRYRALDRTAREPAVARL